MSKASLHHTPADCQQSVPTLSVVIPVYNEEENLPELYRRLRCVLEQKLKITYEIIFVDDGSKDNTWELIERLHNENPNCKGVKFSRNFGHHIAVTAGLDCCIGQAVVLMDGDLQDPPEEIPKLYEKSKEGYDVVYAIRKTRKDLVLKKLASKCFYVLFKILANVEIDQNTGIFRILSRQAVDAFNSCREKSRFITGLMSWTGFSHIGVETVRDARHAGKTKYSFCKSTILALHGITAFSYFPLRITTYIGSVVALLSFIVGSYMLIKKVFFGFPILGYASLIVAITFIGSVQLLIMGIMGEYIGRIYTECQARPLYIVGKKLGFEA